MSGQYTGPDEILYKDAMTYDTFEVKAMEEALHDLKINAFKYLYDAQKDLADVHRFDLKMSDLVRTKVKKTDTGFNSYVGFLNRNFITEKQRHAFKQSQFYNSEISIHDTAANPSLFAYTFLVFINGKFYDNIKIFCDEDKTYLVFNVITSGTDGIPKDLFDSLLAEDANITVFFVPNCAYGIYTTNRYVLLKYKDNLALNRFNIENSLGTEQSYLTFINDNDLLFEGVVVNTVKSGDMLRFTDENINDFQNRYVHLNIFGFRHLLDQIDLPGTQKFFSLPVMDMPIPVENMIIFKNTPDGKKVFAHDIETKMYYPNVYEVLNNDDDEDLTIYVFYFDDTPVSGGYPKYKDEIALYRATMNLTADDYPLNVPEIIKNYDPEALIYGIKDFINSEDHPNHLTYKVNKLKEWIRKDPSRMVSYLIKQVNTSNSFYIDCSDINLAEKYRTNNYSEVKYEYEKKEFNEPRYVFVLRRYYNIDEIYYRFFIDGNNYYPDEVYVDDFYEYYYIPITLITNTSLIEVEKFETFDLHQDIVFDEVDEKKEIDLNKNIQIYASDIFFVNSVTQEFIDKSKFKISYVDVFEIELPTNSFKKIPTKFYVTLLDPSLEGVNITVRVKQFFQIKQYKINNEEDKGEAFNLIIAAENDKSNIRVFKNGRLLPNNYIHFYPSLTYGGTSIVLPGITREIGEEYVVDYTPYKYEVVYNANTIPNTGLIDLSGLIDKPFDLKWFDVYVNGRKLTKDNIEIISSTIILVKNVQSVKNFYIYQKNRGAEYFTFDISTNPGFDNLIWTTIEDFRDAFMEGRPLLDDIEQDIISDIVDIISIERSAFFEEFIKAIKIINPDLYQIPDIYKTKYPSIFQGNVAVLNPDDSDPMATGLKVFPDEDL